MSVDVCKRYRKFRLLPQVLLHDYFGSDFESSSYPECRFIHISYYWSYCSVQYMYLNYKLQTWFFTVNLQ
jgi:hypothetical protein